jgi:hypothetical protein
MSSNEELCVVLRRIVDDPETSCRLRRTAQEYLAFFVRAAPVLVDEDHAKPLR